MNDLNLHDNFSDEKLVRLQLYLAKCGVASRRSSEKIILAGRVSVNGKIVDTLGSKVSTADEVKVDGKTIKFEQNIRYVLLNKPSGYVCTLSDEKGRLVAADILRQKYSERLYNVGRLDMFSSGLIIFTNDGEFASLVSRAKSQIEKEYIVETSTNIPVFLAESFEKGIRIENVFYRCKSAEILSPKKIKIILIEGKNREIRKVFERFDLGIKSLERVRIGNINIGNLLPGEMRELSEKEVLDLRNLCANL